MSDPRLAKLAEQLISYSVELQPGEIIYLEIKGLHALELGKALVKAATEKGGVPFWYYNDEELSRQFIKYAGREQFEKWGKFHRPIMEAVDAYIAVRGSTNPFDLADVDADRRKWHDKAYWDEVHIPVRLKKKWAAWSVMQLVNGVTRLPVRYWVEAQTRCRNSQRPAPPASPGHLRFASRPAPLPIA